MKLKHVAVTGFRAFLRGQLDIALADGINILVGPNNCGKGTLLRALRFALSPTGTVPASKSWGEPSTISCEFHPDGSHLANNALRAVTRYLETVSDHKVDDLGHIKMSVSIDAGERVIGFGSIPPVEEAGDPELLEQAVTAVHDSLGVIWVPAESGLTDVLVEGLSVVSADRGDGDLAKKLDRIKGIEAEYLESLDELLFDPLEAAMASVAEELFPEVESVKFQPGVSEFLDAVSQPWLDVRDQNGMSLVETGSGLRAAAAVAVSEFLATRSERHVICLLEEPESFLHPGAQEQLGERIEKLAARPDVTVVASTESPFMVPRSEVGRVVSLRRLANGRSIVAGGFPGDEFQMKDSAQLFSDAAFAAIFDRTAKISDEASAILVVEGWTDQQYLQFAARKFGYEQELEKIAIVPCEGAMKAALEAILIDAETSRPLLTILDDDEHGRSARSMLTGRFGFKGGQQVVTYRELYSSLAEGSEAENVFAPELIEAFVTENGEEVLAGKWRHDDRWHYDLDSSVKGSLPQWIESNAEPHHLIGWKTVLEGIFERLGVTEESGVPV